MKIHLRQIHENGLHLEGEEDPAFLELEQQREIFVNAIGPVRYQLEVGLSGSGLFATGNLSLDLDVECVNCLVKFTYPLRVPDFAMQTELDGGETVDLTPWVREDILLALPPYPHCDWTGERVCPGALRKTTDVSSDSHAWDALDKLKLKKNN